MTKLAPTLLRGLALAIALTAATASAQDVGETPDDRATSFRASTGAEVESVPGGALLVGAYGLVWAFTLLYVIRLAGLSRRTDAELHRLASVLERAEGKDRG